MNLSFQISNCRTLTNSLGTKVVDLTISGSKIVSVRTKNKKKRREISSSGNVYDAKGNIVLPAFIDCHCHLFSLAEQQEEVELSGSKSVSEMQGRIKEYIKRKKNKSTEWVFGRGWDQDLFFDKRLPSKEDLDIVEGKVPMVMTRICGHVAVANSPALDFFKKKGAFHGIGEELVPSDHKGNLVGIIKENALTSCWATIPKPRIRDLQRLFLKAQSIALNFGLSGVHCILDDLDQFKAIKKLDENGQVKLKVSLFLPVDTLTIIEEMSANQRRKILIGKNIRTIGFKLFADGSLGARTAALNDDYSDDPGNRGILNYSENEIVDYAARVKRLGLVLATHAIGDRAVEQVVSAYRKAGITSNDRFRIEHCSVVNPKRLFDLSGIVLSVQPMFASSDYWLKDRIGGARADRAAYLFRSLAKETTLVGGSDAPVESINPLTGIAAAVSNKADSSESLSLAQAIRMYTQNAAKQSPLTKSSGSIRNGQTCDLVVLDTDSPNSILKSQVLDLFIDGQRI
jgi:predicted amidohydrolase YtcJ